MEIIPNGFLMDKKLFIKYKDKKKYYIDQTGTGMVPLP